MQVMQPLSVFVCCLYSVVHLGFQVLKNIIALVDVSNLMEEEKKEDQPGFFLLRFYIV